MAILRSLIPRRTTVSLLLHHRSLSSVAVENSPSSPPWKRNPVRHMSSSSKPKRGDTDRLFEDISFNHIDVLDDYKFAYEDFKPRDLGITEIEGCDLNHWLITIDFPDDPKPYPEDMIRFYEKTVSKALNLSLEEAKKKIYACSTSNYTGFHVEVSEKESDKFKGKPGVVFILPDSYVNKEKKEYGGDKYINGIIIPRPRRTLDGKTRQSPRKDPPVLPDWLESSSQSREGNIEGPPSYHEPPISAPCHSHRNYHQESPPPPPSYLLGPGYHGPAQQGPGYYSPYETGNYQPHWHQHLGYPYPERPENYLSHYGQPPINSGYQEHGQGFPMWYWSRSGPNF